MFAEATKTSRKASQVRTEAIEMIYNRDAVQFCPTGAAGRSISSDELLDLAVEVLSFDQVAAAAWIARASEVLFPKHRREDSGKTAGSGLAQWQVNKVSNFVEEMLTSRIKADDCAKVVRLSTSHFSRVFKVSFGQTFGQYIIRRRTERAQDLMLLTDEPLCQIALDCGFADQSHLSKLFRRVVGVSPAMWRRCHQTKAA